MGGRGSGSNPASHKNLPSVKRGNAAARGAILLSKAYKAKLGQEDTKHPGKSFAEALADTMVESDAYNKSIKAAVEIADRVEGRPAQSVTLDATLQTPEERVASILQFLSVLKATDGDSESSNQRVN